MDFSNDNNNFNFRILWRESGTSHADKVDTTKTSIKLTNLRPGTTYEIVIKAGNSNGTSQLTPPLTFVTEENYIVHTTNGRDYMIRRADTVELPF